MEFEEFVKAYQDSQPGIFDDDTRIDLEGLYDLARILFPNEISVRMDPDTCEKLAKLVYSSYHKGEIRGLVRGITPPEK